MTITLEATAPTATKRPGDFRRRGVDGPPLIAAVGGELVKSGERKGRTKLEVYERPSAFGGRIEDSYNLLKWRERQLAWGVTAGKGVAEIDDAVAELLALPLDADDTTWRAAADKVAARAHEHAKSSLAAQRGTHGHLLTEDNDEGRDWIARVEAGEDLGLPAEVQAAMVDAWNDMLAATGMQVLAVEFPVVHDGWRQAGTGDRIVRLTRDLTFATCDGELVTLPAGLVPVLDVKMGKLRMDGRKVLFWHKYAVQIACYATGVPYDTEAEERRTWDDIGVPQPSGHWAIIAHLPVEAALNGVAECRLIAVDLSAGRHAAELCLAAKRWTEREDVFALNDEHVYRCPVAVVTATAPQPDIFAGLPTAADTPPAAAMHEARRTPPPITPTHTEVTDDDNGGEGPMASPKAWEGIVKRLTALRTSAPQAYAVLEAVVRDAAAGSPTTHGISRKVSSRRRLRIYDALLILAEHFGDELADEHLRCIGMVIPDAQQPGVPIWRALVALTCAEAQQFNDVALAVTGGRAALHFLGDGAIAWRSADTDLVATPAA